MENNRYYSYNKIKSSVFSFIVSMLFIIFCFYIFDKGWLGLRIDLEVSLFILRLSLFNVLFTIPAVAALVMLIYRVIKSRKTNNMDIMDRKMQKQLIVFILMVGLPMMLYGYLTDSANGPLWVMMSILGIGFVLINTLSFELFKYHSMPSQEEYEKSNFSSNQIVGVIALIAIICLIVVVLAFI